MPFTDADKDFLQTRFDAAAAAREHSVATILAHFSTLDQRLTSVEERTSKAVQDLEAHDVRLTSVTADVRWMKWIGGAVATVVSSLLGVVANRLGIR